MILSERLQAELDRLQKQLSNPKFVQKAPVDAVMKVRDRIAELVIEQAKPAAEEHKTITFEEECIKERAGHIWIEYPFPAIDKPLFLGDYPDMKTARRAVLALDEIFYPFHNGWYE